jgi:hypothetical protein
MLIEVTADDIGHGCPGDCLSCAVALALHRTTGEARWEVHTHTFVLRSQGVSIVRRGMPAVVVDFISDIDRGRTRQPFTFEFNAPIIPSRTPSCSPSSSA